MKAFNFEIRLRRWRRRRNFFNRLHSPGRAELVGGGGGGVRFLKSASGGGGGGVEKKITPPEAEAEACFF